MVVSTAVAPDVITATTLDLYSQAIDASKLAAQSDIALAITSSQA
jgi:hypothetical protein